MNHHLGEDDLDHLLSLELGIASLSAGQDALPHVQSCAACRHQLQELRQFAERLRGLSAPPSAIPLAACPSEDVWLLLAAHIVPPDQVDALLDHATSCDACGLQLHAALADLGLPVTDEEVAAVAAHETSSPTWQADFARRLRNHVARQGTTHLSFWERAVRPPLVFVWMAVTCLIALVSWFAVRSFHPTDAASLLAAAYLEQRTIEPRISGVAWTPLRQERGATNGRMGRSALLRAEAEIASHLQKDPEDVTWLDASGRANMLEDSEDSVQTAVTMLEKANRLDPANIQVSTDLASAYLLRGQFFNRPEDIGLAIELLGKLLASDSGNEVAAFNYALALEKLELNQRAIAAWSTFLDRFPASSWCGEARQRRSALQSQTSSRLQHSLVPLASPAAFADIVDSGNSVAIDALDARIEEYRDVALTTWLPRVLDASSRAGPEDRALSALAGIFAQRHGDFWLNDLLSALHSKPSVAPAFHNLAQAAASVETSNDALARSNAEQARTVFTRAGIPSGRLQADLYIAHLDQYVHRNAECEQRARAILADRAINSYPWLRIDAQLEAAVCSPVAGQSALSDAQLSLSLAENRKYPALLLRARSIETGIYASGGDEHHAWASAAAALAAWWTGSTPFIRGYNALVTMDEINLSHERWYLADAVLNEALPLIAGDPRTTMLAVLYSRLAQVQIHMGNIEGVSQCINRMHDLFNRSAPGPARDLLGAEAELFLARVDLARNQPQQAVQRLERIRSRFLSFSNNYLLVDFYQVSATAYLRSGQPRRAEEALHTGIALDQITMAQIASDSHRFTWARLHEPLYRDLIALELHHDPVRAFALWQDAKGNALRASLNLPPGSPRPVSLPPDTALVSYFQMPSGLYIWVQSGSQLHGRLIPISDSELNLLVSSLVERCANPSSQDDSWRTLSSRLYSLLITPAEPWLGGANHLIFEPDGTLKKLPFNLLLNSQGVLLSDRFAISISPGVDFLRVARTWIGVSPASRALIVGGARVSGWAPLPSVSTEVRTVAASFQHPDLITGAAPAPDDFARRLSAAQIFHFSGHATVSPDAVELVDAGRTEDDPLNLVALHLSRSQLVVLSACSTAQGSTGLFDDAESPVQQLLAARVPAIVASRWNVDSEATALLMKSFYFNLLQGATPSEALRRAARVVRSQSLFARPYYWASFAVYGQD